jgi:acyl-CoA hydrolase
MKNDTLEMAFLAEPNDVNFGGQVHGGEVMKWMDHIGYALAVRYSRGYAVTKFVDNIDFKKPMKIGHLVHLKAQIKSTGQSSMNIDIEVTSEDLGTGLIVHNCSCTMVFVAIDDEGKKRVLSKS